MGWCSAGCGYYYKPDHVCRASYLEYWNQLSAEKKSNIADAWKAFPLNNSIQSLKQTLLEELEVETFQTELDQDPGMQVGSYWCLRGCGRPLVKNHECPEYHTIAWNKKTPREQRMLKERWMKEKIPNHAMCFSCNEIRSKDHVCGKSQTERSCETCSTWISANETKCSFCKKAEITMEIPNSSEYLSSDESDVNESFWCEKGCGDAKSTFHSCPEKHLKAWNLKSKKEQEGIKRKWKNTPIPGISRRKGLTESH